MLICSRIMLATDFSEVIMDFDAKATGLPSHARNDRLHFFKYMNETTAKIVLNLGTLRWSTPEFLNDPFDMQFEMLLHGDIEGIKADALDRAWRLICGDKPIPNETPISETLEGMRTERPRITEIDFRRWVGPAIDEVYKKMRDDRVRPANTFRELSHPGDDLALVPALMLGLDRDLRGWHGSHGDYFRH
ncbi:hypothetical protein [Agrobacterium rosae]|uniref:Uncharacterized protein n=1 Tax=Agrobacterium rosae TaxID=1972867 RepID=A0AAW9FN32_9HYPH|nr:hypothetical protein [Agrobacterium rosae]MDX8305982.1 hypothetical protein [Agrobacterium rosae]